MAKGRKNSRNGGNAGYGTGGAAGGSGGDLTTFFSSPRGGGFRLTSDKYAESMPGTDSMDSMLTVH